MALTCKIESFGSVAAVTIENPRDAISFGMNTCLKGQDNCKCPFHPNGTSLQEQMTILVYCTGVRGGELAFILIGARVLESGERNCSDSILPDLVVES